MSDQSADGLPGTELEDLVRRELAGRAAGLAVTPAPFDEVLKQAIARQAESGSTPGLPAPPATTAAIVVAALAERAGRVAVAPTPFDTVVQRAGGPAATGSPMQEPGQSLPVPSAVSAVGPPVGPGSPSSGGAGRLVVLLGGLAATAALAVGAYLLTGPLDVFGSDETTTTTSTSTTTTSTTTTSTTSTTMTTTTTSTVPPGPERTGELQIELEGESVTFDGTSVDYVRSLAATPISNVGSVVFSEAGVPPGALVEVVAVDTDERIELPVGLDGVVLEIPPELPDGRLWVVVSFEPREPTFLEVPGCFSVDSLGVELCLDRR